MVAVGANETVAPGSELQEAMRRIILMRLMASDNQSRYSLSLANFFKSLKHDSEFAVHNSFQNNSFRFIFQAKYIRVLWIQFF